MILRFAYTESKTGNDATPAMVQEHLGLLTDTLRRNSDVIAVMESGFVGAWGEGHYTQHFGDAGDVEPADWENRNAVVDRLLSILPRDRKVVVRTPLMKWKRFGEAEHHAGGVRRGGRPRPRRARQRLLPAQRARRRHVHTGAQGRPVRVPGRRHAVRPDGR